MTHLYPLTPLELYLARVKHQERLYALRQRGWVRTRPVTRSELADLTLSRWQAKNGRTVG